MTRMAMSMETSVPRRIEETLAFQLNNQSYEVANTSSNSFTLVSVLTVRRSTPRRFPTMSAADGGADIYTITTPYAARICLT